MLYGYLEVEDEERWAASADTAINRKWWDFMADIMAVSYTHLKSISRKLWAPA